MHQCCAACSQTSLRVRCVVLFNCLAKCTVIRVLQLKSSTFFSPTLPARRRLTTQNRSAVKISAAANQQTVSPSEDWASTELLAVQQKPFLTVQVDIEKPLGLQLGAAKGPNGGLVVKVSNVCSWHWFTSLPARCSYRCCKESVFSVPFVCRTSLEMLQKLV